MTRSSRPQPADHDDYAELVAGWVLHALEPDEEARFARHLAECDRCADDAGHYTAALAEVALAAPTVDPPPTLGRRIRDAVRADTSVPGGAETGHAPVAHTVEAGGRPTSTGPAGAEPTGVVLPFVRRPGRWRVALSAAAALAAVVSLAGVTQYQRAEDAERRVTQVAAQLRQRDAQMAAERAASERQAALVRHLTVPGTRPVTLASASGARVGYVLVRDGQVQVLPDGLVPNDAARTTYVLWMIAGTGGNPQPVSVFDVRGNAVQPVGTSSLPSPLSGRVGFAISLEPGRHKPAKPTTVVADGAVAI